MHMHHIHLLAGVKIPLISMGNDVFATTGCLPYMFIFLKALVYPSFVHRALHEILKLKKTAKHPLRLLVKTKGRCELL